MYRYIAGSSLVYWKDERIDRTVFKSRLQHFCPGTLGEVKNESHFSQE